MVFAALTGKYEVKHGASLLAVETTGFYLNAEIEVWDMFGEMINKLVFTLHFQVKLIQMLWN